MRQHISRRSSFSGSRSRLTRPASAEPSPGPRVHSFAAGATGTPGSPEHLAERAPAFPSFRGAGGAGRGNQFRSARLSRRGFFGPPDRPLHLQERRGPLLTAYAAKELNSLRERQAFEAALNKAIRKPSRRLGNRTIKVLYITPPTPRGLEVVCFFSTPDTLKMACAASATPPAPWRDEDGLLFTIESKKGARSTRSAGVFISSVHWEGSSKSHPAGCGASRQKVPTCRRPPRLAPRYAASRKRT